MKRKKQKNNLEDERIITGSSFPAFIPIKLLISPCLYKIIETKSKQINLGFSAYCNAILIDYILRSDHREKLEND